MVRISDARMSGTAYGTIVLHVAPEAAVGGPLALVRSGDRIRLSVKERSIDLMVEEAELARRREGVRPSGSDTMAPTPVGAKMSDPEGLTSSRGYDKLFRESVMQAPDGCDFDFCLAKGRA
jgi:dihydroxy-acid dehydratase